MYEWPLIEKKLNEVSGKKEYEIPLVGLKKGESIPQALQRAIMLNTGMHLSEVVTFLGHFDFRKEQLVYREYVFVVKVSDPYAVEEGEEKGHAWVGGEDAVGYPISNALRETLDLFIRFLKGD